VYAMVLIVGAEHAASRRCLCPQVEMNGTLHRT
jgi:hypothetical protein